MQCFENATELKASSQVKKKIGCRKTTNNGLDYMVEDCRMQLLWCYVSGNGNTESGGCEIMLITFYSSQITLGLGFNAYFTSG